MRIKAEIHLDSVRFHPTVKGLKNRISFTVTYLIPVEGWMYTKTRDFTMTLPVTKQAITKRARKAVPKILKDYDKMAAGVVSLNNILRDERKVRSKLELQINTNED